ncbi:MAP7 domain-containing protein 2 isoform X2 [Alosa sapidissima]|uniref:MAP7 domain-containing protein 2 isoform X2 n=1 Tax=Alosa sapidissima TaxID=34773 RepID=UPI001C0928A1|nr:MAP7 domain-containing protein 2 isoform X2 [Alosa sapidissima]
MSIERPSVYSALVDLNCTPKKDRLRIAQERREEKERIQAAREQALLAKEQRAQKQLERSAEERGRRLEQQRQREVLRRAAVDEKRRQQEELEKERLEALLRRSMERGPPMDQRPKRWTWGGQPGDCQGDLKTAPPSHSSLAHDPASASPSRMVADYMTLSESQDSSLNKRLSSSSATLPSVTERASPSPHRSPYRGSPSRVERKKNNNGGTPGPIMEPKEPSKEPPKEPKTPQMEKQVGCTTPSLIDPSPKRLESPTTPTKSASTKTQKHHGTPKRVRSSKSRTQSPCSPGQYPPSPMRHRASTPCDGPRRLEGEEKAAMETRGTSTLERKTSRSENAERKMPKSASRDLGERSAESPGTPTGKSFAGTTDAEEAARLLAERRRQARVQKELEDKQRAEEERLRAEEEQRRQEEAREQQEQAALWAEQERRRQEEARQQKELEDRRQRERRWQEIQDQWEREKEEAVLRAHREAERKQQERELVKIQEEQERLQRKKRIEEIMKRTRKSEEPKKEDVLVESPSPETVQECRDLKQASVGQRQRPEPLGAVESPLISLQPLEAKSCVADDLSDGVQSMDVSPVSRDELVSVADYSPVPEAPQSSVSNAKALEDLLEITGQDAYPSLPSSATLGDLNKNLIEGFSRPGADSQLIQSSASDKLGV